jgi:hypothetical protein
MTPRLPFYAAVALGFLFGAAEAAFAVGRARGWRWATWKQQRG